MKRLVLILAFVAFTAQPVFAQEGPRIAPPAVIAAAVQRRDSGRQHLLAVRQARREPRDPCHDRGTAGAETHNIMRSFETLLGELGMTFDNVVRATVYLTDLDDYGEMNEAYAQYFPGDGPSRVAVAVAGLVGGAKLEISFIAVKSD